MSSVPQIINAFAVAVDSEYRCTEGTEKEAVSFEELDANKISTIRAKLMRHHNVIITGVSGTGKSYIVNKIAEDGYFEQTSKMFLYRMFPEKKSAKPNPERKTLSALKE